MNTEDAKERIDLIDVISSYGVELKNNKALCPFHTENEPSFQVKDGRFRCFGCGASGDVFDFVGLQEGLDFSQAKKLLYERYGFSYSISEKEISDRQLSDILHRYCAHYNQRIGENPQVWEILLKRGFNVQFVNDKMFGFIPKGDQYKAPKQDIEKLIEVGILWENGRHMMSDVDRIVFPWIHYGRIVYLSCRRLDGEKDRRYKNLSFPPPTITVPAGPELWVTEGVTDTFRAEKEGLKVLGIPGNGLQSVTLPNSVKSTILAFDNDDAGEKYIEKFGLDFFKQGKPVSVIRFPRAGQDLSDYLCDGGAVEDLDRISLAEHFIKKMGEDRKYWKPIIYSMLRECDEFDRQDYFKLIKSVLNYPIAVIKKDYETESREIDREDVFKAGDIQYRQPEGYTLTTNGILYFNQKGVEKITSQLCYVKNVGQDNFTHKQFILLRFGINGKTREMVYRKSQISNTRELIELSNDGLDVHSFNVALLSKFLVDFLNTNWDVYKSIGEIDVITQLGWHDNKFIMPNQAISTDGVSRVYYYDNDTRRTGFRKCGTLDGWVSAIKSLKELQDPSFVVFLLYAGFAGAILEKIGKKSLIIHMFGDSRDGKTVSMMIPASIFGYPDIVDGIFIRWKTTENFLIRQLEQRKNIPFFLDELSSEYSLDMQSIIYQFEGGISKGKASKSNAMRTEPQRTWATSIFSTGEPSILHDKSLQGAVVRAWEFGGVPFREDNPSFVRKIVKDLKDNCGHGVEPFIREFLVTEYDKIPLFHDRENLSKVESSIRDAMQAVYIAGVIAEKVFDFGFDAGKIVNKIFAELIQEKNDEGGILERFLSFLGDYYHINKPSFLHVSQGKIEYGNEEFEALDRYERSKIRNRCLGYIFNGFDLGIVRAQFNAIVQEFGAGNTQRMILKKLKENNIISTTSERNIRVRRVIEGDSIDLIYFPKFIEYVGQSGDGRKERNIFENENDPF